MYNKFDDERSAKQLDDISSSKMNSFLISNCKFVQQNGESTGMIYYVDENDANNVEINDCKFKGKLSKGSHYIDGKLLEKNKNILQIKSCKFELDERDSINIELFDVPMKIDLPVSYNLFAFDKKAFFALHLLLHLH